MIKKFMLCFSTLFLLFVFCGRKEEKIDIISQRMLQAQDTVPLEITHISPMGKTEGYAETFKILVGFNQPMVPLQQIAHDVTEGPLVIKPPIKGKYRWLGTRTLAYIPDDTIGPATRFEIKLIRERIHSLTGAALSKDTSWTFESVRPQLLSSLPYEGAQFIELNSSIYLNFNIEMSPDRVGNKIKMYYTKGMPSRVWCGKVPSGPRFRGEIKYKVRYLTDEEKEDYPLKDWPTRTTLVLTPKDRYPVESEIEVVLYPELLARQGNLGLDEERTIHFNTYNKFRLLSYNRTAPGEGALHLCFSNRVNMRELIENIRIQPEVRIPTEYEEGDWDTHEAYLYMEFKPGQEYAIAISGNLKDVYNNRIDQDYGFTFKKGDYTPHVEMPTGVNLIEAKGDLKFPVNAVNVDSVRLQMGRLGIDEAVPLLNTGDLFYSREEFRPARAGFFSLDRYLKIAALRDHRNQQLIIPIELKNILDTREGTGLVFAQMDNLGQTRYGPGYRFQKAFLEISDIGVSWKYSPENNLVWITSLDDTRPIKKARVQIRNNENRILCEDNTDASGFCELPGWAQLGFMGAENANEYGDEYEAYEYSYYDAPDLWLTVISGTDAAVYSNNWSFGIDPWRFEINYDWYVQPEVYEAYLFTEKGLYRTGESVNIKGTIRKKRRGEWVLPDIRNIQLLVRNARGEQIVRDTLVLNEYGSFHRKLDIDADAPTGVYSIQVGLLGKRHGFSGSFRVEAYRPAEFEVIVSAQRDTFVAGETFQGTIQGRYLFGMPMKDAPMTWNLRRSYHYLEFPQHPDYRFGEYPEGRERDLLSSGTTELNERGEYRVSARLSRDDITAPSIIHLEGVVTAPNMTTITGEQNWLALNANYLIGLKTEKYLYVVGDTVPLSMITVDIDGRKISRQKVEVEVFKRDWKSIKKARFGGRYEWISEQVDTRISSQRVESQADPELLQVVPDSPGHYYVRAAGTDNKRRQTSTVVHFYVAGMGYAGWEMHDDDIIELVADKDRYDVGDTAYIMVKSPYDSVRCLVTVERELVIDRFTTHLRGNADYVKVPIKANYLPNVYICVTLLRGRVEGMGWDQEKEQDMGKPQFRIGYVNLNISTDEKKLHLSVKPDRPEYRPRDTVTIELDARDYKNQPARDAEVALFVVDLGVLNLIDFKTPDPFQHFYGSRPLSVRTIESRVNILGERSYGEKGEERGGGGALAEGVAYREKFISTAFYTAGLRTDNMGKARVRFALPDNLTKFRIMAVAQTTDSKFGSADSMLTVNLPFLISPAMPRFARAGDGFRGGVVLHNRTGTKDKAYVYCRATGVTLKDNQEKQIVLPPNTSKEILFEFDARATGEAVFEFNARMGDEQDALRMKIPVTSPPLTEAVAAFSSTMDSATEAIVVPSEVDEGLGGLQVTLSPTVLAGMDRGIEFLMDYPYYCLEQLMSKILPLIVGEKLINEFELSNLSARSLRDTVTAVLKLVPEYQERDGGFVFFKDSDQPSAYLSAYTMYVLHRARRAGYSIDATVTERGVRFLHDVLRWQDSDWTYPYDDDAKLTTRAFCVYVLALWGENEQAYASRLFENRRRLSTYAKTLLLRSGRLLNMGTGFENELVRDLMNKLKVSPTSAHFEENKSRGWTFPSPAKVTAFTITTIMELSLPFAYTDEVIRWLVQERGKGTKPSTHENAFVFDALQTYYEHYEGAVPDFKASILLGSTEMITQTFQGRTNEKPVTKTISFDRIPKDTLLPIQIIKQGSGRLYYTLLMKYALKKKAYPFDAGFYVWKEITSLDDKPVRRFKRGEVYKVVLHVVTPETRLFAVVDDPLPAGFVPVQTFFSTESRAVRDRYSEVQAEQRGRWWGSFDHMEYYDDKVIFFAQELFPGEHIRVYFVRAATEGRFLSPQIKVEEMYSPEVFGNSAQGHIVIE